MAFQNIIIFKLRILCASVISISRTPPPTAHPPAFLSLLLGPSRSLLSSPPSQPTPHSEQRCMHTHTHTQNLSAHSFIHWQWGWNRFTCSALISIIVIINLKLHISSSCVLIALSTHAHLHQHTDVDRGSTARHSKHTRRANTTCTTCTSRWPLTQHIHAYLHLDGQLYRPSR